MSVSQPFLDLLNSQLDQFSDRDDLASLVVYLTEAGPEATATLVPIGHWPRSTNALPPLGPDSPLHSPAEERRWLPLRHRGLLLGALQVEARVRPWPAGLNLRLQATARCLTEALGLDLERQRLQLALERQQEQVALLVHQLRNPLAALRTFAQLLLRRLDPKDPNRILVENLLQEERQLQRYVAALQELHTSEALPAAESCAPLLLPPALNGPDGQPLEPLLRPLLERAAATANLQGRPWHGPAELPTWTGDSGAVAEIVANLLENAFAYSPSGCPVGLRCQHDADQGGWQLGVWDAGPAIASDERELIFERGHRGQAGQDRPGTGLGLALAKDLAENLGGSLKLVIPPSALSPELPDAGNLFCLNLPPT